jgi:hypothetical protein
VPEVAAAAVAGWLIVLGWRRRHGASIVARWRFLGLQLLLVAWTAAALAVLFTSIERGLLGQPNMQVAGNGSSAALLRWFVDRSGARPPCVWVLSVPLAFYRLAMLAWALWLALALIGWLRWGWGSFAHGGLWRARAKREPEPPSGGAAAPGVG